MTANPTTDQILANLADLNRRAESRNPMPDEAREDIATFVQRLTDTLPGIDPATTGQVLLHTADVYGMWASADNTRPITTEALVTVLMLGEVGRRLYLDDRQDTNTDTNQEQP
jgi:hypothetical protein